ncbi:MAG TPA: diguanylate phosphodiesterase, partial [Clostridia bacterium]|nr:diguanylate phosphodiesterase [Clostridia bacterium]
MEIFLARQPIFDIHKNVYAYEILYRRSYVNSFEETQGDEASKKVMIHTFQTFGIETLTNKKPAFINFTENLIRDEVATLFPNKSLVVEILESVNPDQTIIESCRKLKEKGYTIALDDFVYSPKFDPLIELADIIKIDFLNSTIDIIIQTVS